MNKRRECRVSKSAVVAVILFFVSMMAIDSDSWLPLIVCAASSIWLAFIAYRNGWTSDYAEDEAE